MGKVVAGATVSLDGYIAGPNESGFEHLFAWFDGGDVEFPSVDPNFHARLSEPDYQYMREFNEGIGVLVIGRRTWEIFEGYWPHHDQGDPVSHGINVLPKYVPSTTLKNPTWQNTHVIEGDVEAAVRGLKA
ncbi:MAG TPA: dihydrofolate reductase family protein, partial [Candidatus Limnocylindrales bacterium]